jgi:hypothetical protein
MRPCYLMLMTVLLVAVLGKTGMVPGGGNSIGRSLVFDTKPSGRGPRSATPPLEQRCLACFVIIDHTSPWCRTDQQWTPTDRERSVYVHSMKGRTSCGPLMRTQQVTRTYDLSATANIDGSLSVKKASVSKNTNISDVNGENGRLALQKYQADVCLTSQDKARYRESWNLGKRHGLETNCSVPSQDFQYCCSTTLLQSHATWDSPHAPGPCKEQPAICTSEAKSQACMLWPLFYGWTPSPLLPTPASQIT